MIPKIIHLCWFGNGPYPPLVEMCIDSWKKKLPGFRIMIWNEETFDVNSVLWTKQAYEMKQWAFVSDYVRLFVLSKYGGIYMDTDVEVIKDFSDVLGAQELLLSRIEGGYISCGFIASSPNNRDIVNLLSFYERSFLDNKGNIKAIMNPIIFSEYFLRNYHCEIGYKEFKSNNVFIASMDYYMPYRKNFFGKEMQKYSHNRYIIHNNCCMIHHDLGSWDTSNFFANFLKKVLRLLIPSRIYLLIKKRKAKRVLATYIDNNTFNRGDDYETRSTN